jgi:hypothetical protein
VWRQTPSVGFRADNGATHQRGSRQRDRLERRQLPGQRELYYDHARGNLIEPVYYLNQKTGLPDGVGVGILPKASAAFGNPAAKYTAVHVATTTAYSHWPALTIDSKGNYYLVWDTDARDPDSTNGCPASDSGSESFGSLPPQNANTPLANKVLMSVSTDGGRTWSSPKTVAYFPGHRLLWPWITAGRAGSVGVVWYQYDRVTDPDAARETFR